MSDLRARLTAKPKPPCEVCGHPVKRTEGRYCSRACYESTVCVTEEKKRQDGRMHTRRYRERHPVKRTRTALQNAQRRLQPRRRDPAKNRANWALDNAVRAGHIVRPQTCSRCGAAGKIQGHHPDYAKPFDVIWLCHRCHAREHWLPAPDHTRIPDAARAAAPEEA